MSTCSKCGTKYEGSFFGSGYFTCPDCFRQEKFIEEQKELAEQSEHRANARAREMAYQAQRESDELRQRHLDDEREERHRENAASEASRIAQLSAGIQRATHYMAADMYDDATRSAIEALAHVQKLEESIDLSTMFVQIGVRNNKPALVSVHGQKLIELLQRYSYEELAKNEDSKVPLRSSWLVALDLLKSAGYEKADVTKIEADAIEKSRRERAALDEKRRIARAKFEAELAEFVTMEIEAENRLANEATTFNDQVDVSDVRAKKKYSGPPTIVVAFLVMATLVAVALKHFGAIGSEKISPLSPNVMPQISDKLASTTPDIKSAFETEKETGTQQSVSVQNADIVPNTDKTDSRVVLPNNFRDGLKVQNGTFRGTLSCSAVVSNALAQSAISPIELAVDDNKITWRRGDGQFEENGQAVLINGAFDIDALGFHAEHSSQRGRWRTRGGLTIEDSTFTGSLEQVNPSGDHLLRTCKATIPVMMR